MFSVPKSASMLFGLGGEREQAAVLHAQRAAIGEAMDYLERHACLVRRGGGGHIVEGGRGLIGAAFEHRTSRAGDPQVHTHVLVANGTFRGDGRWAALDGLAIYHHAPAAGHIHEAVFRRELALELRVEWGRVHNGIADIADFTGEQLRTFSRRASEIDAYLAEHTWSGAEARQIAVVRTREAKAHDVTPECSCPSGANALERLGLTRRRCA
jgi:conjugative relaxase-like TrwC/TraI family protein